MKQMDLSGTGVALVTPFNSDESVDYNSLGKIVDHVSNGGVDYLVVMGTTGESVTVTNDEKKKILDYILERNNNKLPVVLGIGGYNSKEVAATIKNTSLEPFSAILSVSPYYNKPSQEGIYQHYKLIAESTDKPVILYNVPGRTGKNIKAGTTLKLAHDFKNIISVKEASGDLSQVMEIIRDKPDDFQVISGDDALTFPMMALGGCGVISVVANAYPSDFTKMVNLANAGKFSEARELHYKLLKMIGLMFAEGSPSGVKAVLKNMGLCENIVRLPLTKVSDKLLKSIFNEVKILS